MSTYVVVLGIGQESVVDQLIFIYCRIKYYTHGYYCLYCSRLPMHFQKLCVFKLLIDVLWAKEEINVYIYSLNSCFLQ